jgi:hypothetical protein
MSNKNEVLLIALNLKIKEIIIVNRIMISKHENTSKSIVKGYNEFIVCYFLYIDVLLFFFPIKV